MTGRTFKVCGRVHFNPFPKPLVRTILSFFSCFLSFLSFTYALIFYVSSGFQLSGTQVLCTVLFRDSVWAP